MTLKIFASAFFGIVAGLAMLFGGFSYLMDRQAASERRQAEAAEAACLANLPVRASLQAPKPGDASWHVVGTVENRCQQPLRAWTLEYEVYDAGGAVSDSGTHSSITLPTGATTAWDEPLSFVTGARSVKARATRAIF